jgi:predicted DCC family thiol-disulfide oxidoreductase YuxK
MDNKLTLIYDGDCILCQKTAMAMRLQKTVGQLILINARENDPKVSQVKKLGFDLNQGIVVEYQQHYYHGAQALHLLALLSTGSGVFNRSMALVFRFRVLTRLLYPLLKLVRRVLLKSRGLKGL